MSETVTAPYGSKARCSKCHGIITKVRGLGWLHDERLTDRDHAAVLHWMVQMREDMEGEA